MAEQEKDIAIRKEQVELQLQQRNKMQGLLLIKRGYGGLGCSVLPGHGARDGGDG